ncbi:universal stress protein [Mucilaginibacter sp.]|jgi:nucleotide-binding universal stress UspA family protein|uniref:universal stress protein n=1 Tax=Mucilaginibacter sp. TaxID=1882438 RepID=UPI002C8F0C1A|nr:universal stress protein [Mucilaginibacter sp.]HTI60060.1 universal stress protein [Mucilaginibacter sp.]
MKKISAVFDGLRFSEGTLQYAIQLAEASKALLSGVFLEPFHYHSFHMGDMIGSHGISPVKLKHLLAEDNEIRRKYVQHFEDACKNARLNYAIHRDENFAVNEIVKESVYSDLALISKAETFSNLAEARPTRFVADLLEGTQCPVMVVPGEYKETEKVVLLYDGKPSSVFAIKMFNYMMPWMRNIETEIISVSDPGNKEELPEGPLIKEFIDCHYPGATYTLLKGNPEQEIVNYLKQIPQNTLIVLGAYKRGSVSRWFKTSMADILMKEVEMPLFIAHYK